MRFGYKALVAMCGGPVHGWGDSANGSEQMLQMSNCLQVIRGLVWRE